MNIFRKLSTLVLLASLALPAHAIATPSFFQKALDYVKEHPYVCTGVALGIGGFSLYKFYRNYKIYCEKVKREREALHRAQDEKNKKDQAEAATRALQEHLDGQWPNIERHLDWYIDLLNKGANPDTKGKNGTILTLIPRIRADYHRYKVIEVCELLIERKADLNLVGRSEKTPLMLAAEFGSIDMLRLLLKHGANSDLTHELTAETALMIVIKNVESRTICRLDYDSVIEDIVKNFLDHGADPNIQDRNGDTALMHAVNYILKNSSSKYSVDQALRKTVILLLRDGAHVNLKNNQGHTAIDLARAKGDQKMLDLIVALSNFKAIETNKQYYPSLLAREVREMIRQYITQSA